MKRNRIILVALAALLLAAGIVFLVRRLTAAPVATGLSAPIALVEIPPGEFLMGSPEDEMAREAHEIQHRVRITYPFQMGKTEVTQKQWREVMGTPIQQQRDKAQARPSLGKRIRELARELKDDPKEACEAILTDTKVTWMTIKTMMASDEPWPLCGEDDDCPMYFVNWDEAMAFCARLTEQERAAGRLPAQGGVEGAVGHEYRLPTEAEWEYACRAGSTTRFANGDTEAELDKIGWHEGNSGGTAHSVGMKILNAWGLHDMHGNVEEWCLDWHGDYPADEAIDPVGPAKGASRIYRGGSWFTRHGGCWIELSQHCRSAYRGLSAPDGRSGTLGFRVVLAPVRPR